jgi:hypothetical protein
MHDLDRTYRELETESFNYEFEADDAGVLHEADVNQLASEVLTLHDDQELEYFLGKLIKKVGSAAGKAVHSPLGRQIGGALKGVLKDAARTALPQLGSTLGNALVPGVGGTIGGKLAGVAGHAMGLELEGLSQEDREFEGARHLVKSLSTATHQALAQPTQAHRVAADTALQALQHRAPVRSGHPARAPHGHAPTERVPGQSGHWVREGNRIILYGV